MLLLRINPGLNALPDMWLSVPINPKQHKFVSRVWLTLGGWRLSGQDELNGCTVANIDYEYMVDGVGYVGWYEKPFLVHASGVAYAESLVKGEDFKVRLKPGDPSVSLAEPGGWARM